MKNRNHDKLVIVAFSGHGVSLFQTVLSQNLKINLLLALALVEVRKKELFPSDNSAGFYSIF